MQPKQKTAAGALFVSSKTKRVLLNLRAPYKTHKYEWSLFGGMIDGDETPKEALDRECTEEMGFVPSVTKTYPIDIYESRDKNFRYYTFVCIVEDEFIPVLNEESIGYTWIDLGTWPKPMHSGARNTFCSLKGQALLEIIVGQH
jgi:8-oxo-dGTP pyrophosphatase MutT (NUDIX family)